MRRTRDSEDIKIPKKKAKKTSRKSSIEEIIANVNLEIPEETVPILPSKYPKILCLEKLKQGTQIIGQGLKTAVVIVNKIHVLPENPKAHPNKNTKPELVPMKY